MHWLACIHLFIICQTLIPVSADSEGHFRNEKLTPIVVNGSSNVHIEATNLQLAHFMHRGSLHVDKIELRSEGNDRHAFYVQNPTDPRYPLWVAARASVASLWPKVSSEKRGASLLKFGAKFKISFAGKYDDVMHAAASRYSHLLFRTVTAVADLPISDARSATEINSLSISVANTTFVRYPHLAMREDYEVKIDTTGIKLIASENWGVVRGLETISQLIFVSRADPTVFLIKENEIRDKPHYIHRGLMMDTARHFIKKSTLLENLDAMAFNKLNVFHWHIVDDQSFPFLSDRFPNLALKSAYPGGPYFYSTKDIREIIEFARLRGIRVIPEFDSPDHTHSWGHAMPEIMSWCKSGSFAYTGPLNPANEVTFAFLAELFHEVTSLFPDEYLHLGMDEVSTDCWRLNSTIQSFMTNNGMSQHSQLVAYYCNRLLSIISKLPNKKKIIVWEDILNADSPAVPLKLPENVIVQVWITRDRNKVQNWEQRFKVIRSEDWYLDHQEYGADWVKRYNFNPGAGIGGEACMWTEYQSDLTVTPHMWPSVSAAAERLWAGNAAHSSVEAAPRIEEQACRMQARAIRVGVGGGPNMCQLPGATYIPDWFDHSSRWYPNNFDNFGIAPNNNFTANLESILTLFRGEKQEQSVQCKLLKLSAILTAAVAALLLLRRRLSAAGGAGAGVLQVDGYRRLQQLLQIFISALCLRPLTIVGAVILIYLFAWVLLQRESW